MPETSAIRFGSAPVPLRLNLSVLDVEAVAPLDALVASVMIDLTHASLPMLLSGGLRIFCPNPGPAGAAVQVYADGEALFAAPVTLSGRVRTLAMEEIRQPLRLLTQGARLQVMVTSLPPGYATWRGLRVSFVFSTPQVVYAGLFGPDDAPVYDPQGGQILVPTIFPGG